MNRTSNRHLHKAAVAGALAAVGALVLAPSAAAAAGDDVNVVNTETVQAYLSPDGTVESKRVYEQLALTGDGEVSLRNPIETNGLRNLDGFGGFTVEDGEQVIETSVDGRENFRSVSSYDGQLPVTITPSYTLDGEEIAPEDLVGRSGRLDVEFTVVNQTTEPREVTFDDGRGGQITRTVDVPLPMLGSLSTTAPKSFTDIDTGGANTAGDGQGGTRLTYTLTLFPPLGSDTVVLGYSADVQDAVVPQVDVSMLPLDPLASPTFKTAAESYRGGAETGARLVAGATEIDTNLLKLRDGANELLGGLLQLSSGADELDAGLADEAAPGARRLADGAGRLDDGLGELADGSGRLVDGARTLADGTQLLSGGAAQLFEGAGRLDAGASELAAGADDAHAGSRQLADGAQRLSAGLGDAAAGTGALSTGASQLLEGQQALAAGLKKLYDGVQALPTQVQGGLNANPDYQRLLGGLSAMIAGIGDLADVTNPADPDSPRTLLGGVNAVTGGLSGQLKPKLESGKESIDGVLLPAAKGAYAALAATIGCPAPSGDGLPPLTALGLQGHATLGACFAAAVSAFGYGAPKLPGTPFADGGLSVQLAEAVPGIDAMVAGLDRVRKGLSNPGCDPAQSDPDSADHCGVAQGLAAIQAGVPVLVDQLVSTIQQQLLAGIGAPSEGCDPQASLRCGAAALVAGADQLSAGIDQLADGMTLLRSGGLQLAGGADALTSGLGLLDAGAGALADGSDQLASGAGELADGAGRLDAGAGELAEGAGRLSDGARTAKDGSGQVADGAGELADGLGDAADGSGLLADGLDQAAKGAPQLVDGANRLSVEGMGQLEEAGVETAVDYGEMFATIQAGSERASDGAMAFGAPEGATGLTAYSFVIKGDDGESGRNWARTGAAALALAASGGVLLLRRRLV